MYLNIVHRERNNPDPRRALEDVGLQPFRQQSFDLCNSHRPVRKQQIVPMLSHCPASRRQRPRAMRCSIQNFAHGSSVRFLSGFRHSYQCPFAQTHPLSGWLPSQRRTVSAMLAQPKGNSTPNGQLGKRRFSRLRPSIYTDSLHRSTSRYSTLALV
jgi:hypothetical protein